MLPSGGGGDGVPRATAVPSLRWRSPKRQSRPVVRLDCPHTHVLQRHTGNTVGTKPSDSLRPLKLPEGVPRLRIVGAQTSALARPVAAPCHSAGTDEPLRAFKSPSANRGQLSLTGRQRHHTVRCAPNRPPAPSPGLASSSLSA